MYKFVFNGVLLATIRSKRLSVMLSNYYSSVLGSEAYVITPNKDKIRCSDYKAKNSEV